MGDTRELAAIAVARCVIGLVITAAATTASAQVYRCAENGKTTYQDRPCAATPAASAAPSNRSLPPMPARVTSPNAPPDFSTRASTDLDEARGRLRSLERTQRMRAEIAEIQRERERVDHDRRMRELHSDYRRLNEQRIANMKAREAHEREREEAASARIQTTPRYRVPR